MMAFTPASARALEMSIDVMRACGCGLRSTRPKSMPGSDTSDVYVALPVTRSPASIRCVAWPNTFISVSAIEGDAEATTGFGAAGIDPGVVAAAASTASTYLNGADAD